MSNDKNTSLPNTLFGKRLKEARVERKLSQKKLGILAGIDEFSASPRINQYERGTHTPDYKTACLLAEVLDIPACYFYVDDENWLEIILLLHKTNKSELEKIRVHLLNN